MTHMHSCCCISYISQVIKLHIIPCPQIQFLYLKKVYYIPISYLYLKVGLYLSRTIFGESFGVHLQRRLYYFQFSYGNTELDKEQARSQACKWITERKKLICTHCLLNIRHYAALSTRMDHFSVFTGMPWRKFLLLPSS